MGELRIRHRTSYKSVTTETRRYTGHLVHRYHNKGMENIIVYSGDQPIIRHNYNTPPRHPFSPFDYVFYSSTGTLFVDD